MRKIPTLKNQGPWPEEKLSAKSKLLDVGKKKHEGR
jgi:hypothetical protein